MSYSTECYDDQRKINWKQLRRKRPCPNRGHYPDSCLQRVSKSQKLRSGWQITWQRFKTGNPNTSNKVFPL